jgi:repressor of nif and glnA expression
MTEDLDERTYDLLRLIRRYEPIGSIRLVTLMERHGYSIQGRTIRLTLSDLDERGMTEKLPGKGRRLTKSGQASLNTGNVGSRLEQIRSRIATLTSQVTYDPVEDTGELISAAAYLDAASVEPVLTMLAALDEHPLAPCLVTVDEASITEPGDYRLTLPSSLTLDGVLLSGGIGTRLVTGGIAEYTKPSNAEDVFTDEPSDAGGEIRRYIDVISGEDSSVDIVTLLLEADRTDVSAVLNGDPGRLIIDNREFPLGRYEEGRDLAVATRNALGGVVDLRRTREDGPFPMGNPGWEFCSLTYSAIAEIGLGLLTEREMLTDWTTLYDTQPRNEFEPASITVAEY